VKTIEKSRISIDESVFGIMPDRPLHLSARPLSENPSYLSGSATLRELEMELNFGNSSTSLFFLSIIPKRNSPCPAVIVIGDEKEICSYAEEWVNRGYALFFLEYKKVSENNDNFKSGISAYISPSRRKKSSAGKTAVWAWAAIRVLEYAEVLYEIDKDRIGVAGKGVFGFSVLLANKYCNRFSFVLPFDTPKIDRAFVHSNPHLFSPSFAKNAHFDNIN